MNDNKVISFDVIKINRDCRKICTCKPPAYEIDVKNRLIQCTECGAYIDPFDAMVELATNGERLEKQLEELIERKKSYAKEVNELYTKRFRLKKFRDLQNCYLKDLMPYCPRCEQPFDPTEITSHSHKNYCGDYKKKREGESE